MLQTGDMMIWHTLKISTGLGLDSGKWLAVQWESTGLDWAFCQPIWPGKRATGIHWSTLEYTGVHMDYVGEGVYRTSELPNFFLSAIWLIGRTMLDVAAARLAESQLIYTV
ncbi:uncharacterized protein LACBIDRAFT_321176 [Laccaria bicolor S238N-H82]|uniref:Predicted protein n=1 Tax=Laccaria bicolor (strain S238N-H82 / ATCC MYA-4686) TaxID=486041 RepID=B0CNZ9_LACBS|nr:uncharacterized protein LACBIDRAFT_321176 [Laccaria bicolor S238N-H82]EDR15385.1 predicted protein [Laccaria bicolor S238N-H82]|eukprot:XP_001873593.1 predicted protein [Laccaria bicolor S238N-H82]